MNKFRFTIKLLVIATFVLAFASISQAQATRTWVSGVGDDANPCSRTAPCKTFPGAISKTAVNGEINCLDPGGFGAVTITKSITIDCHEIFASILVSGTNAIIINADSVGNNGRVNIRNINFNGVQTGLSAINIIGTTATNVRVVVEDCMMDGFAGNPGRGIFDNRSSANSVLVVNNTSIRNMASTGISVTGTATSKVSISNSRVTNCQFGVAVGGGAKVTAFDSVFVSNTNAGLDAESGASIDADHCVVSNNATAGFSANGGTIRVSNTTAVNNGAAGGTLATTSAGGVVSSYGNNQTGGTAFPSTGTGQT